MLPQGGSLFDQFVLLWVVIEPINVVSVFLAVTSEMGPSIRIRVAVRAIVVAAVVLLFFIVAGQLLLEALGVSVVAFQLAGGVVLFVMALSLIFGRLTAREGPSGDAQMANELAIFPIGIPAIAGPGTMLAVVLLTDNHRFSIGQQAVTAGVLAMVLLITLAMLIGAQQVHRVIGKAGAGVISRVTGLILTAIAANNILEAITIYFKIPR